MERHSYPAYLKSLSSFPVKEALDFPPNVSYPYSARLSRKYRKTTFKKMKSAVKTAKSIKMTLDNVTDPTAANSLKVALDTALKEALDLSIYSALCTSLTTRPVGAPGSSIVHGSNLRFRPTPKYAAQKLSAPEDQ